VSNAMVKAEAGGGQPHGRIAPEWQWKIPERLHANAFEHAELEVLKDRFALQ